MINESKYWNPLIETLPLEKIQSLQLKKFKKIFEWTYTHSKFHRSLYEKAGINLHEGKKELVRSRLSRRLRAKKMTLFKEYYKFLMADESGEELIHMLDAISTNLTRFFREPKHFDFLKRAQKFFVKFEKDNNITHNEDFYEWIPEIGRNGL